MLSKSNCILLTLLFASVVNPASAQQSDSTLIVQLLKNDYATMGTLDIRTHMRNVTSDYRLIEHGEIWDIETELDSIYRKKTNRSITRTDVFTIKTVRVSGDIAYAVWHLYSGFSENGKLTGERFWYESGAFRREEGRWKIALIHSSPERRK